MVSAILTSDYCQPSVLNHLGYQRAAVYTVISCSTMKVVDHSYPCGMEQYLYKG